MVNVENWKSHIKMFTNRLTVWTSANMIKGLSIDFLITASKEQMLLNNQLLVLRKIQKELGYKGLTVHQRLICNCHSGQW